METWEVFTSIEGYKMVEDSNMVENVKNPTEVILNAMVKVMESDPKVCNLLRYMDYGCVRKLRYSLQWLTKKSPVANLNNCLNNTQLIRLVDWFTPTFMTSYKELCKSGENTSSILGIRRSRPYYYYGDQIPEKRYDSILNSTVNVDSSYTVTGKALTICDFIYKNNQQTSDEISIINTFIGMVERFIVVGDQCQLLAFIDSSDRVYIDLHVLKAIYKKSKNTFKNVVLNLMYIIRDDIVWFTNLSISQVVANKVVPGIFRSICSTETLKYASENKTTPEIPVINFSFTDDKNTDASIRDVILPLIEDVAQSYILKELKINSEIENNGISRMLKRSFDGLSRRYYEKVRNSYINGVCLGTLFNNYGWNVMDSKDGYRRDMNGVYLDENCTYIYKNCNIIPTTAILRVDDSYEDKYRVIKKSKIGEYSAKNSSPHITKLIIRLDDGSMYAVGKHPNVSDSGTVCMGDLKGKVDFSNTPLEQVDKLLKKCEDLLKTINYTSSYTYNGKETFMDPDMSEDLYGNLLHCVDEASPSESTDKEIVDVMDARLDTYDEV